MARCQTNGWISRNLDLKGVAAISFRDPIRREIASAGELLLELRLYESCLESIGGASALVRACEPPAGPKILRFKARSGHFSENGMHVALPLGNNFSLANA